MGDQLKNIDHTPDLTHDRFHHVFHAHLDDDGFSGGVHNLQLRLRRLLQLLTGWLLQGQVDLLGEGQVKVVWQVVFGFGVIGEFQVEFFFEGILVKCDVEDVAATAHGDAKWIFEVDF